MKKTAVTLVYPSPILLISEQLKSFLASLLFFHLHSTYLLRSNIVMLHLTISKEKFEPRPLSHREILQETTSGDENKPKSSQ